VEDIGHDEFAAGFQNALPGRKHRLQLVALEILQERVRDDEIERICRQLFHFLRRECADLRLGLETLGDARPHSRCGFAQQ